MTREEQEAWLAEIELADLPHIGEIRRWLWDNARNTKRWRKLTQAAHDRHLKLWGSEGKHTLASAASTFIHDRLREVSFARRIMPPTSPLLQAALALHSNYPITPADRKAKLPHIMLNTPATREAICNTTKNALQSLLRGKLRST